MGNAQCEYIRITFRFLGSRLYVTATCGKVIKHLRYCDGGEYNAPAFI